MLRTDGCLPFVRHRTNVQTYSALSAAFCTQHGYAKAPSRPSLASMAAYKRLICKQRRAHGPSEGAQRMARSARVPHSPWCCPGGPPGGCVPQLRPPAASSAYLALCRFGRHGARCTSKAAPEHASRPGLSSESEAPRASAPRHDGGRRGPSRRGAGPGRARAGRPGGP